MRAWLGDWAWRREQRRLCRRYGVTLVPSPASLKVGVAESARQGLLPVHGLRLAPEGDTTGWYVWAGDELSEDDDFFKPLCVKHLSDWCPAVIPYLGLPPGWRFVLAPGHEDVWFDEGLLRQGVPGE